MKPLVPDRCTAQVRGRHISIPRCSGDRGCEPSTSKKQAVGGYKLNSEWIKDVPQMRVRNSESRKLESLLELAVLNERLSGNLSPWEVRRKLEHLKMRRKNWEMVYDLIAQQDVTATLSVIEEAYIKVRNQIHHHTIRTTLYPGCSHGNAG